MSTHSAPSPDDPLRGTPAPDARPLIFISSNGVGTGHLMRLMSMARRASASYAPLFVTLSQALPAVRQLGFPVEYIPSYAQTSFTYGEWHEMLRTRIAEVVSAHSPAALIFDGTHPYVGLVRASSDHPEVPFVWSRRGMWRPGTDASTLSRGRSFELIIEPGELAAEMDAGPTRRRRHEAMQVDPLLLLDTEELLAPREARERLDLDPDRPAALVQLGAGNINDIDTTIGAVVKRLGEEPGLQVCVAQSVIASDPTWRSSDVRSVSIYPLARYLRAFDLAVSAAGYNSFHELVCSGVPTLFLPNVHTAADDQRARAEHAARLGVALCAVDPTPHELVAGLDELLDPTRLRQMRERSSSLDCGNGAPVAMAAIEEVAARAGGRVPAAAGTSSSRRSNRSPTEVENDEPEPPADGVSQLLRRALAWLLHAVETLFRVLPKPVKRVLRPVASPISERLRAPLTEPTVLILLRGPDADEVERLGDRIAALRAELGGFVPVFVTSSDDFRALRRHDAVFEYLVPEDDWEDVPGDEPWSDYVDRRIATLIRIHRATHVVVADGDAGLATGVLRAIGSGGR